MTKTLNLYSKLLTDKGRFLDEVFELDCYASACPKLTIVDIGAFTGEFGFYCYNFAKKIYAIEPDPVPFAKMKEYVDEFRLNKFEIFPIAIGGKSELRSFGAEHGGGSHFVDDANAIQVETLTLEDFFKQNNIDHVDILKIDAESAEYEIFKDTFKNIADKIDCIIGEDHIGGALEPILKGYGFNYTNLSDGRVNANIFIAKR